MNTDAAPPTSPAPKPRLARDRLATHLDHLIRTLDILIYCELSILYYMDSSLLHFLLRAVPQWLYFTPKPVPLPAATPRPYVGAVLGTNALVVAGHVWAAVPGAGEAMRGYRHGGLVIDFVGERAPVARWRLVGLDLLLWGLQLLVLGVFLEREAVRRGGVGGEGGVGVGGEVGPGVGVGMGMGMGQDYDAEERGVIRAEAGEGGDIELRDMGAGESRLGERERDDLLAEPSGLSSAGSRDHPLDIYHTGEHVIADLHILDTLRRQWAQYGSVAAEGSTSTTTGSQTAMAAAVAGRRFGFRLRVGDRVLGGGPS